MVDVAVKSSQGGSNLWLSPCLGYEHSKIMIFEIP